MIFKGFTDEYGNVIPVQGAGTVYNEELNSLALGKDTVAIGKNQLVFGRGNVEDANKVEIVGGQKYDSTPVALSYIQIFDSLKIGDSYTIDDPCNRNVIAMHGWAGKDTVSCIFTKIATTETELDAYIETNLIPGKKIYAGSDYKKSMDKLFKKEDGSLNGFSVLSTFSDGTESTDIYVTGRATISDKERSHLYHIYVTGNYGSEYKKITYDSAVFVQNSLHIKTPVLANGFITLARKTSQDVPLYSNVIIRKIGTKPDLIEYLGQKTIQQISDLLFDTEESKQEFITLAQGKGLRFNVSGNDTRYFVLVDLQSNSERLVFTRTDILENVEILTFPDIRCDEYTANIDVTISNYTLSQDCVLNILEFNDVTQKIDTNIRTLDWDGNETLTGGLTVGTGITIGATSLTEEQLIALKALLNT